MNVNGGVQYVDFKNISISTTSTDGVTIEGIYEQIEGSYRKMLVGANIVIDDLEVNDIPLVAILSESIYKINLYGKDYTIDANDLVKVVEA